MTRTASRVHRPHQHLDPHLRRILVFAVAYPMSTPAFDEHLRRLFDLSRHDYERQLDEALAAVSTSPEEIALADIVRARANDPDEPDQRPPAIVVGKQITIHGKSFVVELDMAEIFLKQATQALLSGNDDLILLRHTRGVEMIPILRHTPYEVTDITCGDDRDIMRVRREYGLNP